MQTERRVAANPQTKPTDLGCESADRLLPSADTIAIYEKMEAVSACTTQNNKIKHTFAIHRLLRPPSYKHAHSRGTAANFSSALSASQSASLRKASRDILLQQITESYLLAE